MTIFNGPSLMTRFAGSDMKYVPPGPPPPTPTDPTRPGEPAQTPPEPELPPVEPHNPDLPERPLRAEDVVMFRTYMLPLAKNDEGFAWEVLLATPCGDNRNICFVQSMKIRPDGTREVEEQNPCNMLIGDLPKIVHLLKEWESDHPGFGALMRNPRAMEVKLSQLVAKRAEGSIPPHYSVVEKILGAAPGKRRPPSDNDGPMISPF